MTTLFEQFKTLKDASDASAYDLRKFVDTNKRELLKSLVDELAKIEGFNKLIIKGYTPGFNDGDACTHSSDTYYVCTQKRYNDFGELSEYGIGISYFLTGDDEIEDEDLRDWEGFDSINTYSEEDSESVDYLVGYIDYLVEEIHYTNYIVYVDLTGDEPKITEDDYYCGY
jgi:hypothetical protein